MDRSCLERIDMHDAPGTFNARKYPLLEKHRGNMWALAAYTPQAFSMLLLHINELVELGFPVLSSSKHSTKIIQHSSKLEPFMKLNSKRSKTESGTQLRSIRDQNDPSRLET